MNSLWNLFLNWYHDQEHVRRHKQRKRARKHARLKEQVLAIAQSKYVQDFLRSQEENDD